MCMLMSMLYVCRCIVYACMYYIRQNWIKNKFIHTHTQIDNDTHTRYLQTCSCYIWKTSACEYVHFYDRCVLYLYISMMYVVVKNAFMCVNERMKQIVIEGIEACFMIKRLTMMCLAIWKKKSTSVRNLQ